MKPVLCLAIAALCVRAAEAQTPRVIKPDTFFNTLSRSHAVIARIKLSEVAFTRLLDAGARDYMNVQRPQPSNPMVGPIYIEGAEPGDGLEPWATHMVISAKGEYEVVTVMGSAALRIAKRWLPGAP